MKNYITNDAWCIVEEGFHAENNEITESLCSLGNGRMGQRGNFEETFTGKTLLGNYVAGVYYPDKTRVGWWKNGYPEYFAKVLNAANWNGIKVEIGEEVLDLHTATLSEFRRVLRMQEGVLERTCVATLPSGKAVRIFSKRFCSIVDDEAAAIAYSISPLNFEGKITLSPFIDGDIKNKDANYDEKFWDEIQKETAHAEAYIELRTKKTGFHVLTGMKVEVLKNGQKIDFISLPQQSEKYVANQITLEVKQNETLTLYKYACNLSSMNHEIHTLKARAKTYLNTISEKGFEQMLSEQKHTWAEKWKYMDIVIDGDVAAQQGIRFNIFQLCQTYTGEDARLNIGPKGFTGEKYGGSTYWDTEAYCIPFYLATANQNVARNLLVYRHKQLGKAIENAEKLGFSGGAALYPMVTMNGEECHNEWEITFEEIHRNGAIAYAISDYVQYTNDEQYLIEYGLEVLLGIARFWAQRVNYSEALQKYVMLGVTGPNEYENNVNNNWYTNYIACWCMQYAMEVAHTVKNLNPEKYASLCGQLQLDEKGEFAQFRNIVNNMYYPKDEARGIVLQQDGYLDKENITVAELDPKHRPLNQKWSWDRILRSPFIKQADVLQGFYFFEDDFSEEEHRRNFDYYEPRTVHESSLSPCVHSILACKLGKIDKAYEMYLRTSRLDLDDYNNDTEDGLHITSMAGTWMSVVKGFGGMRVREDKVYFSPICPEGWAGFSFKVRFRGALLHIQCTGHEVNVENLGTNAVVVVVNGVEKEV